MALDWMTALAKEIVRQEVEAIEIVARIARTNAAPRWRPSQADIENTEAKVRDLIAQHCPFKADTAYEEVDPPRRGGNEVGDLIHGLVERLRLAESTRTLAQHDATLQTLKARDLAEWRHNTEHACQSIVDALTREDYASARLIALRVLNEGRQE